MCKIHKVLRALLGIVYCSGSYIVPHKDTVIMVAVASTILWYIMTMHLTSTSWSFPDSAIGKKYILARTSNGYELVPDGSKVPGIPVSTVVAPNSKPQVSCTFQILVHEPKQRFCQHGHGRHPKIGRTNFGGILPHSARVRKQKLQKSYVLSYVLKITTN